MTRKEEKQQLRRTVRALERELSPKYKEESSRAICRHLIAMPAYQAAGTVFCLNKNSTVTVDPKLKELA